MRVGRIAFVLAAASSLALTACGGGGAPPATQSAPPATEPPAAAAPTEPAASAAPADAAAAPAGDLAAMIAAADIAKGKTLFLQCRACHSLTPESEPGKIGPTLYGVIGRPAGSVAGFAYSDAVATSGKTWTVEEVDHWLEKPSEYLPGNKMVFIGLKNPQDRANVLAYIQQESAKPVTQ
jgi:cytochrome c